MLDRLYLKGGNFTKLLVFSLRTDVLMFFIVSLRTEGERVKTAF